MWAAAEGHVGVVSKLLETGADGGCRSKAGLTAFLYAVREGRIEVVRGFLESRPVVAPISADELGKALVLAVRNAHYELAGVLLDAGSNPNTYHRGYNALHVLTWIRRPGMGTNSPAPPGSGEVGSLDLVRQLVTHGLDINARMTERRAGVRTVMNFEGATPLLLAVRTADVPLIRLLLELGADPEIANTSGTTPMLAAVGVGVQSPGKDPGTPAEVYQSVALLLDAGGDINHVNDRGETVMHGAAYKCAASSIPLLALNGAEIRVWNTKNKLGWTPLRIAVGVHRGMNLRSSPEAADALRQVMIAAGVSTEVEPETNISGATK